MDTYELLIKEVRRQRVLHVFTSQFLKSITIAADREPCIELVVFPEPLKLAQFVSPVIAVAKWREQ